jgi:hypothetical protein
MALPLRVTSGWAHSWRPLSPLPMACRPRLLPPDRRDNIPTRCFPRSTHGTRRICASSVVFRTLPTSMRIGIAAVRADQPVDHQLVWSRKLIPDIGIACVDRTCTEVARAGAVLLQRACGIDRHRRHVAIRLTSPGCDNAILNNVRDNRRSVFSGDGAKD